MHWAQAADSPSVCATQASVQVASSALAHPPEVGRSVQAASQRAACVPELLPSLPHAARTKAKNAALRVHMVGDSSRKAL